MVETATVPVEQAAVQWLCSLADVKVAQELDATDTDRDGLYTALIGQASEALTGYAGREFTPTDGEARTFRLDPERRAYLAGGQPYLVTLAPSDLRKATEVVLHPGTGGEQTLADGEFELLPDHPHPVSNELLVDQRVPLPGEHRTLAGWQIRVTGNWGFPEVPADVRRAAVVCVQAWVDRAMAEYGSAYTPDTPGMGIAPSAQASLTVPFASRRLLDRYRRPVVG